MTFFYITVWDVRELRKHKPFGKFYIGPCDALFLLFHTVPIQDMSDLYFFLKKSKNIDITVPLHQRIETELNQQLSSFAISLRLD